MNYAEATREFTPDEVSHPIHYNQGKIEVIEFLEDQKLGFHLGNVVKYVARAGKKVPVKSSPVMEAELTLKDLQKARWYLDRYIELVAAAQIGREPVRPNDMKK